MVILVAFCLVNPKETSLATDAALIALLLLVAH
jgi:hypothetical protein